jgi:hypothetical protein
MLRNLHPGITLAVSLLLLAVLVAATVYPAASSRTELKQQRASLRKKIEEQRALHDVYEEVRRQKRKIPDYDLPATRSGEFATHRIGEIGAVVSSMARDAGLRALTVRPRSESAAREEDRLLVRAELQGELDGFRTFLLRLLSRSYVRSLPMLRIRSDSGESLAFELEFELALG